MERSYRHQDFQRPTAVCDVIMQGGITSGVVYPLTLLELAKRYRFSNVGGTSAGAIAAAVAAAAEHGRSVAEGPGGKAAGFTRLADVPNELGRDLFGLFQPSPAMTALFGVFVAMIGGSGKAAGGGSFSIARALVRGYALPALIGAVPGLVGLLVALFAASGAGIALALLVLLLGVVAGVGYGIFQDATRRLPAHDFGLCSGISQDGNPKPGFTDWLADLIDEAAGRDPKGPPLTFGEIAGEGRSYIEGNGDRPLVNLRMMTTNLAQRRPYSLPFEMNLFAFRKSEWEQLFPKRVVDYLTGTQNRIEEGVYERLDGKKEPAGEGDLYWLPRPDELPLVVAARLSLSFPGLIRAVPLYMRDYTLRDPAEKEIWRRCLFSDGGLSSNFPLHFFDALLPSAPTFGVSLEAFDGGRHDETARAYLADPADANAGGGLPLGRMEGVGSFVRSFFHTAKNWQDYLQSTQQGYRDRIVHVALKANEGGLNLTMPPETIAALAEYGAAAGTALRDDFHFDDHRWRRFLVTIERLSETVDRVVASYDGLPDRESFGDFLDRYPPETLTYRPSAAELATLRRRIDDLVALGRKWKSEDAIEGVRFPKPKTDLRITPRT